MVKKVFHQILCSAVVFCGIFLMFVSEAFSQEITAIDFNGEVIGKVIPDGKVVGLENQLLGNVTADSLIVDFDGNIIGGVVPQGIAIGNDNKPLGKVGNDGTVRLPSGKIVARVLPNGLDIDEFYNITGAVLFPGLIYSDEGTTIGRFTGNGSYTNLQGQEVGFVSADGYAFRRLGGDYSLEGRLISSKMVVSNLGEFMGSIAPGGAVTNFEGRVIGRVKANGYVYNDNDKIIGNIVRNAYAISDKGVYLGVVTYNGEVFNKADLIGKVRADGNIVNDDGEVIGYAVDMSATATDFSGAYLGRILPEGKIARSKEVIGYVGARRLVYDNDGKLVGKLVNSGPVFDYKGTLAHQALKNGSVTTLEGTNIGYMQGNIAYDNTGRVIGGTYDRILSVNENNKI